MNGRNVLAECGEPPGAFFRRCHPGRAFPVWLAKMLEYMGEDDPGFEELWSDVAASRESGRLDLDLSSASAIGMLVHARASTGSCRPGLTAAGTATTTACACPKCSRSAWALQCPIPISTSSSIARCAARSRRTRSRSRPS